MANLKKRWLTFEIYPDNPEQMAALDWLKSKPQMSSGMYIYHKKEDGDLKDHIHVMVYVDNPLNCRLLHTDDGDILVCDTYAKRFGTFEGCKTDTGFLYKSRGDDLPEGCEWQTYQVIKMVQGVSDPQTFAWYFLHARYCDRNKIPYDMADLHYWGDDQRFKALYGTEYTNKATNLQLLCQIGDGATPGQLLRKVLDIGDSQLLKELAKNPYFIKTFVCNSDKGLT